ncbi:unnamed protein product [Allacma fusca]|nr:unnamed protein product [Allacma fusca]
MSDFRTHGSDSRITKHSKNYRFFPDQEESFPSSTTPACCFLISGGAETTTLQRGTYTYPFELKLHGQARPAPFKSTFGRTYFKVTLHVISLIGNIFWSEKIADEKLIKTAGYLRLYPNFSEPIQFVFTKERSFFSKRPPLKLVVTIEKMGYLPGEKIFCQIQIQNFALERISEISVSFVQRITYYDNLASKVMVAVLDEQGHVCDSTNGLTRWDLSIPIPGKLMPSFGNGRKCIEVNYFLQVRVEGKSSINGEREIIIGTTRNAESSEPLDVMECRRVSVDSLWDTMSVQSGSTNPPSYSELSSRRTSVDTLPPVYDSVVTDSAWLNSQILNVCK